MLGHFSRALDTPLHVITAVSHANYWTIPTPIGSSSTLREIGWRRTYKCSSIQFRACVKQEDTLVVWPTV